jgi:hypothetical protein
MRAVICFQSAILPALYQRMTMMAKKLPAAVAAGISLYVTLFSVFD